MSINPTTTVDDSHHTNDMSLVMALTACQVARSCEESARNALTHAVEILVPLRLAYELTVEQRRLADYACDTVRIFKDQLAHLELRSIQLNAVRNEARLEMVSAQDESTALSAGRRMLAAEHEMRLVCFEAQSEQVRVCKLVGFERKDMQPFTWHSELLSLSAGRRNRAVAAAGRAKSDFQAAEIRGNQVMTDMTLASDALRAAETDLEMVVRTTISLESPVSHTVEEPDVTPPDSD